MRFTSHSTGKPHPVYDQYDDGDQRNRDEPAGKSAPAFTYNAHVSADTVTGDVTFCRKCAIILTTVDVFLLSQRQHSVCQRVRYVHAREVHDMLRVAVVATI